MARTPADDTVRRHHLLAVDWDPDDPDSAKRVRVALEHAAVLRDREERAEEARLARNDAVRAKFFASLSAIGMAALAVATDRATGWVEWLIKALIPKP